MKEKGFIKFLLILLIALALLKYFLDWSIFDAVKSEQGGATIEYLRDILSATWHYILIPVNYVMSKFF